MARSITTAITTATMAHCLKAIGAMMISFIIPVGEASRLFETTAITSGAPPRRASEASITLIRDPTPVIPTSLLIAEASHRASPGLRSVESSFSFVWSARLSSAAAVAPGSRAPERDAARKSPPTMTDSQSYVFSNGKKNWSFIYRRLMFLCVANLS